MMDYLAYRASLQKFTAPEIAEVVWSFAYLQHYDRDMFAMALENLGAVWMQLTAKETPKLVWGFSMLGKLGQRENDPQLIQALRVLAAIVVKPEVITAFNYEVCQHFVMILPLCVSVFQVVKDGQSTFLNCRQLLSLSRESGLCQLSPPPPPRGGCHWPQGGLGSGIPSTAQPPNSDGGCSGFVARGGVKWNPVRVLVQPTIRTQFNCHIQQCPSSSQLPMSSANHSQGWATNCMLGVGGQGAPFATHPHAGLNYERRGPVPDSGDIQLS